MLAISSIYTGFTNPFFFLPFDLYEISSKKNCIFRSKDLYTPFCLEHIRNTKFFMTYKSGWIRPKVWVMSALGTVNSSHHHYVRWPYLEISREIICVIRKVILLKLHVVGVQIIHFRQIQVGNMLAMLSLKKYGPLTPPTRNPHWTVNFSVCIVHTWIWCGLLSYQIRQFFFSYCSK